MDDYENRESANLYQAALVELEHAKMAGRIGDARGAIAARLEKLRGIPGLHVEERQAIEDALRALGALERVEERYEADERRIAEEALAKLKPLAPKFEKR